MLLLQHWNQESLALCFSQDIEFQSLVRRMQVHGTGECGQRIDGSIVGREHDVSDLQAGGFRRSARLHVGDQHSPTAFQAESCSQRGRDRLRTRLNLGAVHVSVPAQTFVHEADDAGRNSESDAFAASAARQNESIDSDHVSVHVDQRSATVPRIDGRVGLDVHHSLVGIGLPRD